MKKSKKILCGIACICILIGAIMMGAGLAMGGSINNGFRIRGDIFHLSSWRYDANEGRAIGEVSLDVDEFDSIDLDVDYGDIEIKRGNDFEVLIENVPEDEYTVHQDSGTLKIKQKNSNVFNFGFNSLDYDYRYTIIVPRDMNVIKVNSAMGDIDMSNVNAEEIEVYQSMGAVDLQDVNVSDKLLIEQSMGEIDFIGVCEGSADFSNSMGDTDIEILADEADYQYELSTSMGTLEINGKKRGDGMNATFENGNGKHRITADNSMGDISLEFR